MWFRVRSPNDIREIKFELRITEDRLGDYEPHFNLAQTTRVPVMTSAEGERTMEWVWPVLIPSWAKDSKMSFATFSVRAYTVASEEGFLSARKARRCCLVAPTAPMDGARPISSPSRCRSATGRRY